MHNEKRTHWWKEGLMTLMSGATYGITSIAVGHPMDTVKTKMQAQQNFLESRGLISIIKRIWRQDQIKGFYVGALSPLIGSTIFRSIQFSVFESIYTYFKDNDFMKSDIPYTKGIQPRVIMGGLSAGMVRTFIECPFEYAKVKKQTGQKWNFRSIYKGVGALFVRTTFLLGSFMIMVDAWRRHTNLMDSMGGQFTVAAVSGSFAWILVWPFENLKNVIQAETKNLGHSWNQKFSWMVKTHGVRGIYRGILPGLICVSTRNGASMVAMTYTQAVFTKLGLRDK